MKPTETRNTETQDPRKGLRPERLRDQEMERFRDTHRDSETQRF